ncbi:MAG: type II toxin-antitoxin system YafQ family toxin [Enterococcus sp.]|nr:type II toxin-antitoxin system YafQ family toxin [Enterococcus sp.]
MIIDFTPKFLKDYKRLKHKHWEMSKLDYLLGLLQNKDKKAIPLKYHDHQIKSYKEIWEIHVIKRNDDWLVLYRQRGKKIVLLATGSHDYIFKKVLKNC